MMSEVIESIDITARVRGLGRVFGDRVTVTAALLPDYQTRPEDFDCYDQEDIRAWRDDEWQFVGVVVTVLVGESVLGVDSLWGVEYGELPTVSVDPLQDEHPVWDHNMVESALAAAAVQAARVADQFKERPL